MKIKKWTAVIIAAMVVFSLAQANAVKADQASQSQRSAKTVFSTSNENSKQSSSSSTSQENGQQSSSAQNNQASKQKQNKQTNSQQSSSTIANKENKQNNGVNRKTNKKPVQKTKVNKTQLSSGWQTKKGKRYYLRNGKVTKGLRQINHYWYLFDKNGAMLTALRKIPHQQRYGYFDNQGRRRFANTQTARAYYWIDKSGKVTGIKNYARVISQRPNMPTGCEITAVTMMLNFAGVHVSKEQATRIMPRSHNPNKGFIGSPYKNFPLGYWVAPGGVKPVVDHYLGHANIMTGCSLSAIKKKLLRSHLVVVWVGWFDGFSNHALALTGYHGNTLYYNDPWTGTKRAMSVGEFERHWALDGHRAISY